MRITVFYTQQAESSNDQLDVKEANKKISDVAFNFQNIFLGDIENDFQNHTDEVEIVLSYNKKKIFWAFKNEVSEKIKETIREKLKGKAQIEFQ